jgi:hypothetical protein
VHIRHFGSFSVTLPGFVVHFSKFCPLSAEPSEFVVHPGEFGTERPVIQTKSCTSGNLEQVRQGLAILHDVFAYIPKQLYKASSKRPHAKHPPPVWSFPIVSREKGAGTFFHLPAADFILLANSEPIPAGLREPTAPR